MQSQVLKAKALDVFDMGLIGMLIGIAYASAFHHVAAYL